MIRRPPISTLSSSSAASDVYKRQGKYQPIYGTWKIVNEDQPVPLGKYKAAVQFTPNDTVHYTTQTAEADGRTRIVLDVDKTNAMTGDTISILVRPSGENLQYQFYAIDSNGKKAVSYTHLTLPTKRIV